MGEDIRLKSAAGEIGAYLATPAGTPKGGIVVIQEIFGVNHHIRGVTDKFAAEGYLALAPRFFDHIKPGIELGYTPDTIAEGRGYVMTPGFTDKAVQDVQAAMDELKNRGVKKVGVTGYCWGGTISWLAATAAQAGCGVPPITAAASMAPGTRSRPCRRSCISATRTCTSRWRT